MSNCCLHEMHSSDQHVGVGSYVSTASTDIITDTMVSSIPSKFVRTILLVRPSSSGLEQPRLVRSYHGSKLGFSIRGGHEYGTGFFISNVEIGSEAHRQGLKVGDQIVGINGFTLEEAVHKEILQLISNSRHIRMKVRYVGMIPVKDVYSDLLTWQIISECNLSMRSSPNVFNNIQDIFITIHLESKSKLGCGICKGPDWKPGIFIQFTKEGSIAREAGLRTGDQILSCNNADFSNIAFNEAINIMKASSQLDLIVRKYAGPELFPGESSGYNSSASSVAGDQSPSYMDLKRLSSVKEESSSIHVDDSLLQIAKNNCDNFNLANGFNKIYKPTIINVSENGTTIKVDGNKEELRNNVSTMSTDTQETSKEVKVKETKREFLSSFKSFESNTNMNSNANTNSNSNINSNSNTNSNSNVPSEGEETSLSSAIAQELLKRSKRSTVVHKLSIDEKLQMNKKLLAHIDTQKQEQHDKLMDEFRKAHQRMFKSSTNPVDSIGKSNNEDHKQEVL